MVQAPVPETHLPLTAVYGGGGVFGIAYGLAVAQAFMDAGVPLADVPSLGTSAGSWVASALTQGIKFEDFDKLKVPRLPTGDAAAIYRRASVLFADSHSALVTASAVCLSTGRRRFMRGDKFELRQLVAASSAVPGLFPPVRVGGQFYVDGGMWSAASGDCAPPADRLLVVAPFAGHVLGPAGFFAEQVLRRELRRWEHRHGGKVHVVHPDREIASHVHGPLSLFDAEIAREIYPLAYEQGVRSAAEFQSLATV